jgi:hypothetical protein
MSQKTDGRAATDTNRSGRVGAVEDEGAITGRSTEACPHCGQPLKGSGLEQFLGRLGITEEMVSNLKGQFQNVEIDEYLNTARDYLKGTGGKAEVYAKENPGKVAAGVAALAFGAGLLWCRNQGTETQELEDRFRQLELDRALAGRKYRLEEVLSELGVTL